MIHLSHRHKIQLGWHRSKDLIIPANIEIEYLPPYSPELNPVERFWEHIKRYTIRNLCILKYETWYNASLPIFLSYDIAIFLTSSS